MSAVFFLDLQFPPPIKLTTNNTCITEVVLKIFISNNILSKTYIFSYKTTKQTVFQFLFFFQNTGLDSKMITLTISVHFRRLVLMGFVLSFLFFAVVRLLSFPFFVDVKWHVPRRKSKIGIYQS